MSYATPADLQAYVSADLELPVEPEQQRLLDRATEVIAEATLQRIDTTVVAQADAAELATCAQVEWWLTSGGDDVDTVGPVQGYSVGSLQVQYGSGANRTVPLTLARRARRHLFLAGLLDRRVGVA